MEGLARKTAEKLKLTVGKIRPGKDMAQELLLANEIPPEDPNA